MSSLVMRMFAERIELLQSEGQHEGALKLLLMGAEHGAAVEQDRKRMHAALGMAEILEAPDARKRVKQRGKLRASDAALAWAGGA